MKQNEYLFYGADNTFVSAHLLYAEIKKYLPEIHSIIDLGCGMAAFSKVLQEDGVEDITLIDHPSFDASKCFLKENFRFVPCDLDKELPPPNRVDLAICTEVLEHINEKRSLEIVDFLAASSDIIIFSAAVPRQGGLGHINEQRHGFWINEFRKRGYDYSDAYKSRIMDNPDILYWLRQNIFIFHKNQKADSPLINSKLIGDDFEIVSNSILNRRYGFLELVKMLPESFAHSFLKRFK